MASETPPPGLTKTKIRVITGLLIILLFGLDVMVTGLVSPWDSKTGRAGIIWILILIDWVSLIVLAIGAVRAARKLIQDIDRLINQPAEEALVPAAPGALVRAMAADGTREVIEGILLPYSESQGEQVWTSGNRGTVRVMVGSIKVLS